MQYLYIISFICFFPVCFYTLTKTRFEELFKPNQINYIKLGYILMSFILAHLLASFIEKIIFIGIFY